MKEREEKQKQQVNYLQMNSDKQEVDNCILEIECKCESFCQISAHLGKLYLYYNRLLFVQYDDKKQTQTKVFYGNIKNL